MYNEYQAPEILEIGKAREVILGEKDVDVQDEAGLFPTNKRTIAFADHEQ
jgi:hypothetical protein